MKAQDTSPRDQALAHAKAVVGTAIEEQLRELGGAHPAGGADTILEAWVDVQTPCEAMGALLNVGTRRLEQQQELIHIPNPTGYLISTLRHLAEEGMLKGWKVDQMQVEDEEKHAQAVRSAAQAGNTVLTYDGQALLPEKEPPSEVLEVADTTPQAAFIPNVPESVEVADAATVAAWQDHVPDPQGGQARSVSMLWGFVREAIRGPLNIARQQQLDALIPKWDATRPRTLLLLCDLTYTARAVELNLRREIEPQIGKLLSDFFDEMQVVYTPDREGRA